MVVDVAAARLGLGTRNWAGVSVRALVLGAAFIGFSPMAALADPAPATESSDEIVVTARLRQEPLQHVPVSVSVLDGRTLTDQNLNDIQDISAISPSVGFRAGASNKDRTVFLRGVGTITTSPGVEPSVSTVLDGVVLTRPGQSTLDLVDVDRIEILRGPQGTLFGKNASAGVVNIVSTSPTDQFHGFADVAYYEGGEDRERAGISGQIAPGLDGLISLLHAEYRGNVDNLFDGHEVNGYRRTGGRARFVYAPNDAFHVSLALDYINSNEDVPTGVFVSTSRVAYPTNVVTPSATLAASLANAGIQVEPDNTAVSTNFDSTVRDRNGGAALQVDWELGGGFTLTSITGYRSWKNKQHQDYDQISQNAVGLVQGEDLGVVDADQTSEELRIASPRGGFIDYVAGVYYLKATDDEVYRRDVSIVAPPAAVTTGIAHYGTSAENYAIFGEANLNFTPKFRAILGYRAIWDDLSYYHNRVSTNTVAVAGVRPNHTSAGSVDKFGEAYRAGLQYDLADNITAYGTYSRGYKGPAYNVFFNMQAIDEISLNPETSDAYELGLKGVFFDGRVRADLAAFDTKFDNYQANFTDSVGGAPVTRLINAGTVISRGVEGDLNVRATSALNFDFSFARTDAFVDHFNCPTGAPVSCDINGQPLPYAPDWKLHGEAQYTFGLSPDWDLRLATDVSWQSKVQYQLAETPDTIQKAYGIWNASATLAGVNNGWQLRGLVKNILNQHYSSYLAGGTPGGVVRWVPRDDSRYVGLALRRDF